MEVHYHEKPELKAPSMVAAWPGMGMLAKLSVDHLIQQLETGLLAEIHTARRDIYFRNGVGRLVGHKHGLHYWKGAERDLILCSGEGQPKSLEILHRLADKVVDIAERFGVRRVYTMAAVPHPYKGQPKVVGVVNQPKLKNLLEERGMRVAKGKGSIAGLNGLLIGVAGERGIEGICLMCEIRYINVSQPTSSKKVLETLTKLLNIQVDMAPLERQAEKLRQKVEKLKKQKRFRARRPREPEYIG